MNGGQWSVVGGQCGPIPTDSDGRIHPELIPVAAFLDAEEYDDFCRAQILERLADGVPPRVCARDGVLDWRDLAAVQELLSAARRPAPVSGGAPEATAAPAPAPPARELCDPYRDGFGPDPFPRFKTEAERAADRADVLEWFREHPDAR